MEEESNAQCHNINTDILLPSTSRKSFYFLQVTRAAVQTFVHLFEHAGREMEELKGTEAVADALFTKTADTNRFIRRDSLVALDAMAKNVSRVALVVILVVVDYVPACLEFVAGCWCKFSIMRKLRY